MSWEIVVGIITLAGFVISIMGPLTKLTKIMTELTVSVQGLKEVVNEMGIKNTESHKRLWEHNNKQDESIENHERRISKIEYDIDKYHSNDVVTVHSQED